MLEIKDLSIEVNHKIIIEKLSIVVNKGDKVAIIGEEGNGKSTLLKAIMNECSYAKVTGSINYKGNRLGYLEQMINEVNLEKSVFDYLFSDMNDYYSKVNELYKYISDLKIAEHILEQKTIKYLSGGEKVKLQLLKLLLENPDILLLDEPTNDLDIETLEWLETFINRETRPILYVTHDETLLSNTANTILHLELLYKKTKPVYNYIKTSYDDYINKRVRSINHTTQIAQKEKFEFKKQEDKLKQIRNRVDHELNTISRSQPHAAKMLKRKMQQVKSQERRMDEKELTTVPDVEEAINFFFDEIAVPNRKEILNINIPELKIGNHILGKNINIELSGNKHIVIIGKNGCGKTTLLNEIYKELKDRTDIKVGYMWQFYDDILLKYDNPISYIYEGGDINEIALVRRYMGNLNITREEMIADISKLSGGTKAKLILLKLMYDKCNVLILDEPTRNISPLSNPIIRKALSNYKGTIISVSHDRKYINEVCDSIYLMDNETIRQKYN